MLGINLEGVKEEKHYIYSVFLLFKRNCKQVCYRCVEGVYLAKYFFNRL